MNRFLTKNAALATSLVLMGATFVGCSSGSSSDGQTDNGEVTTAAVVTTAETLVSGEIVEGDLEAENTNEDISISIENVYRIDLDNDTYDYIGVYVDIVNNSDVDREFSNLTSFGVRASGSDEDVPNMCYPPNAVGYVQNTTDFNILRGTVAPGTMLDGLIVIGAPKGASEVTLVFYPNVRETTGEITFTIPNTDLEALPATNE